MSDAYDIAAQLGETQPQPIALIGRILRRLGHVQTGAIVDRVREIEQAGGMPTSDGSRRRTPGGVFFALVKQHLEETGQAEAAVALFPPRQRQRQSKGQGQGKSKSHPVLPVHPPPPPLPMVMRPRVRGRPGAPLPAPISAPPPAPSEPLESNAALGVARQHLTPEMGCYAIGARQEARVLAVRFSYPDVARERYAREIARVERESGWRVELHPAVHQGNLATSALRALPKGLSAERSPSIRAADRRVTVRCSGQATADAIEVARQAFRDETGWELAVETHA
ncbi:MAG: hypothetical protein RLZZ387_2486 [Chloroflexota bacterium]